MSDEFVLAETLKALANRMDAELYALSDIELAAQFYFQWDERSSLAWNFYQFSDMLETHKRRCRRWEEHHHGVVCVVERVRDKYIMPQVKLFLAELQRKVENGWQ